MLRLVITDLGHVICKDIAQCRQPKVNKENFSDKWGDGFFQSQNKILQSGIGLGLLPNIGDLNALWIK
jgi:hypothetical protein